MNSKYSLIIQWLNSVISLFFEKKRKRKPFKPHIPVKLPRVGTIAEESHLEQLEFISSCSFLIALNMILHLRIITYHAEVTI
jgi:hypothetical protein